MPDSVKPPTDETHSSDTPSPAAPSEVETFRLQVDAGALRVDGVPVEQPPKIEPSAEPAVNSVDRSAGVSNQPAPASTEEEGQPENGQSHSGLAVATRPSGRRRRKIPAKRRAELVRMNAGKSAPRKRHKRPDRSWAVSFTIHAALFATLSLLSLQTVLPPEISLSFSEPSADFTEELELFEVDFTEQPAIDFDEVESDDAPDALEDLADFSEAVEVDQLALAGTLGADNLADVPPAVGDFAAETAGLFGDGGLALESDRGRGSSRGGPGRRGDGGSRFFGAPVGGLRAVFLLDNSGSMQRGRLETVLAELMHTLDQLGPSHEVYVLFFSDDIYPMYYPASTDKFARPNEETKRRLSVWFETVEFCTGNTAHRAMEAAARLKPEVVFLLSDGDVRTTPSGRKLAALLAAEGRDFVVHTIGMGCQEQVHRQQLAAIAQAHGGTFREVAVAPGMRELALARSRPYHDYTSGPGAVWGLRVPRRGN
ncbi:MAG: vWA domain-containing protein [Planctomycetota bacterium]